MVTAIGPEVGNGAKVEIEYEQPYMCDIRLEGVADMLFHRYDCDSVKEKSESKKGSKAKKTDNIESYVYRDADGLLCLPGEYLRQAVIHAAKFRQDPRSPRKSAMDLFKAGVVSLSPMSPIYRGKETLKAWDYEHKCRVVIQRSAVTRVRPAIREGWQAQVRLLVTLPEYISPKALHETIVNAGRLCGLADFRPTYGRYSVVRFEIVEG